jgi:hypothetical protein
LSKETPCAEYGKFQLDLPQSAAKNALTGRSRRDHDAEPATQVMWFQRARA